MRKILKFRVKTGNNTGRDLKKIPVKRDTYQKYAMQYISKFSSKKR